MDITNDELVAVEVAETEDNFLVYQIWETDDSVDETSLGNLAGQDQLYRVGVVGELENPREYGENLEAEASVRKVTDNYHEWVPDLSEDENIEAFIYGYDRTDPRDGDRPGASAELSSYSDPELEDKLSAAFSGVTLEDL